MRRKRRFVASMADMVSHASLLHIRLFYAAYFAAMGIVLPFFPVYLAGRGMDVAAIGVFTGLLSVAKVLAPPAVGRALDGYPHPARFILFASLAIGVLMMTLTPLIGRSGFTINADGIIALLDWLGIDAKLGPIAGVLGLYKIGRAHV